MKRFRAPNIDMMRGGEVDVVLLMLEDIWRFWGPVPGVIARDLRVALAQ